MVDVIEEKVLDDLFMVRQDGFESLFVKKYGEPEEIIQVEKVEQEFIDMIKDLIQDEKMQEQIIKKFYDFKETMRGEQCFWMKPYYELGFTDGINLNKEIAEFQKPLSKDEINETFFNQYSYCVTEYLGTRVENKEIIDEMDEIKKKYPKIKEFIEDGVTADLSKEEQQALLEYIKLQDDIARAEKTELFKLGMKEGILF